MIHALLFVMFGAGYAQTTSITHFDSYAECVAARDALTANAPARLKAECIKYRVPELSR